ncbi:IS5 family transposase [Larkinella sp. C7]|uniref:IS5 family transposase n=1 Tax=Larkinella sp. C7 TaxID=2576607 RepID=UPI001E4F97B9|nr:IS5 family transposase [Larkinella sp. C7]
MFDKDIIETHMLPYLRKPSRGMNSKVPISQIVAAILYRLKTGCQWRQLPVERFFEQPYSWQSVYHYFRKWANDGSFKNLWVAFLTQYRAQLDLSCIQLDGSQTPAKNGGDAIGYQSRKRCRTTNLVFLCDNQGQMLACSQPLGGEFHDSHELKTVFEQLTQVLQAANLPIKGLFLNADAGFDTDNFRHYCQQQDLQANIALSGRRKPDSSFIYFDELLYQRRLVIERANAWLDSLKALVVRYEQKALHWQALHWLAFSAQFIRTLKRKQKL